MPSIKFSKQYPKLNLNGYPIAVAKLLQVIPFQFENLTAEMIEYDAANLYQLPATGPCLILVFLKPSSESHLFTTIRPDAPGKREYYQDMVGQVFGIDLVNDPKPARI